MKKKPKSVASKINTGLRSTRKVADNLTRVMRKSKAKTVSVKAWGVFVAGNVCPDETFPKDWRRLLVRKYMENRFYDDFVIRPITITYRKASHAN